MNQKWNRRSFLGGLGVLAGSALSGPTLLAARGQKGAANLVYPNNVYEDLGVTTVINGQGTMTMLGGSLIPPEVEAAMQAAARHYVSIPDLEVAAGKKIAQILKLPEGCTGLVTSGAAGAIQCGYSGVLTGNNPDFIKQLPHLEGMKSEVIIQKSHRYPFDHQIRATGVKLVEIETREDFQKSVSPRTSMLHFTNYANGAGHIKVDEWVKLAKQNHLPCFNDAAADTPPVSHLWDYVNMGYDLVTFSGGKAIRGPQCAGLLLGRKDLIGYALLNNSPYEDTLGRGQKVGKEEIVGMVKALEIFVNEDHKALTEEWWRRLDTISRQITKVPGVSTAYFIPNIANHVPTMEINWDPRKFSLTPQQAFEALKNSKPSIILGRSRIGLSMNSFMLQPGDDKVIARQLAKLFRKHQVSA
ncbi:MAG: aminotransferase class V-fold PLP-dependent enzyme [Terriglobia bacterium]